MKAKRLGWKVVVRMNGKQVDQVLCVNKAAARAAVDRIVYHGFGVYSDKIDRFSISILKNRSSK